jgi:hypothetical protein
LAIESRLTGIEGRISGMEQRFVIHEDRMSAMLAIIVRIAERLDGSAGS